MSHAPVPRSRVGAARLAAPTALLWAGAAAAVPTLIRLTMDHVVSDITIFPAYFPFVLAAAAFLGWRSAVVATVLSALAANFMFMGPRFEFSAAVPDIVSTLLFLVSAGAVIVGVERLKSAGHVTGLGQGASGPAPTADPALASGPGLLLAALLGLASWIAMICGLVHLFT